MSTETLVDTVFKRAKTIDILAEDVAELVDAAAQLGMAELVGVSQILNSRGLKIGILREYGERRRKYHAIKQREWLGKADKQLKQAVPGYVECDCLK